jgi:Domain of unknown function (DUF4389)
VAPKPIRLIVREDDLVRPRLTVLFRLVLAIPHLVWLALWSIAAWTVGFAAWLAVVIEAEVPAILHDFLAAYVRYATHVNAYVLLAARRYPGFRGRPGYEVDIEIDSPARQSRWSGGLRLIVALPALVLASVLAGGLGVGGGIPLVALIGGAAGTAAFLAWFAGLAIGRIPRGLRDLAVYGIGYGAQAGGYVLLLTGRYPDSLPAHVEPPPELPPHPVGVDVRDELRRSRVTTFFRWALALPHFVWLALWSVAAFVAALIGWLATLVTGRLPLSLHRFLAAYVRYTSHVFAFVTMVGGPFPGFVGRHGSYPIEIEIELPEPQRRLVTLFRLVLALPALIVAGALQNALLVVAVLGWFASLFAARMPEGMRDLGAIAIRYNAQAWSYLLLVTARYPNASPALQPPPSPPAPPEFPAEPIVESL